MSGATNHPLFTNLWTLRERVHETPRDTASLLLEGTVCAVNARRGLLVLQDASGVELLELDAVPETLRAGQIVRLRGEACEVMRRRTGLGLRRLPLLPNDALNYQIGISNSLNLPAGRHPIRVEWFNGFGPAWLQVDYAGPDIPRQPIPASRLSHVDPQSGRETLGLTCAGYEEHWARLPDFALWPVAWTEVVSNFTLNARAQAEFRGAVFSGMLTVTEPGNYTFALKSDDASRLYLGQALPEIEVVGNQPRPLPVIQDIGAIAAADEPPRWVTMEGTVRYVSTRAGHLELELRSPSNNRLQVDLVEPTGVAPALLLNAQVRLTGVGRRVFSAGGQGIWGLLTVVDGRGVHVLSVPPETWAAHPEQPLAAALVAPGHPVVHVRGRLIGSGSPDVFEIADGDARLSFPVTPLAAPSLGGLKGQAVAALGVLQEAGPRKWLAGAVVKAHADESDAPPLPLLLQAQQVLNLSRAEASRGFPVRLRGVITCVWPDNYRNVVLQDESHGIFLWQPASAVLGNPRFGEFWEIEGVSGPGNFSPMVHVRGMRRLGEGRLPESVNPEWNQIINGSLDNQFVEMRGVVTDADAHTLTLLTQWGRVRIRVTGEKPPRLTEYENKLVRVRGCLQAVWDPDTRQVRIGEIQIGNLAINTDQSLSTDPFAAPSRTVEELRLYDLQANAFRRVRMAGQFLLQHGDEGFMLCEGYGLRFLHEHDTHLQPGDLLEVAGVPDLLGAAPVIHEAACRRTGSAPLPPATKLDAGNLLDPRNDATRVQVEGTVLNVQRGGQEDILEMRAGPRNFIARVPLAEESSSQTDRGSVLRLTGVYAGQSAGRRDSVAMDSFELLLDSSRDLHVVSRPPWWTFRRLLLASSVLAGGLGLAGIWIVLLRRQVERRTAQLERANRQRERAERDRVIEAERLRIARDLHDDLGSSLTEISMLGNLGLGEKEAARGDYISQIVKKARESVNALDVIVWAVNPRENTLQSLADYLAGFADEFLTASGIVCRLNLPVSFPEVTLDGRTRHELFLAAKEALNNAVRHARATEVELSVAFDQGRLSIRVSDNGQGFTPPTQPSTHGVGNMQSRLEELHGKCHITSVPGQGTTVTLDLQLTTPG